MVALRAGLFDMVLASLVGPSSRTCSSPSGWPSSWAGSVPRPVVPRLLVVITFTSVVVAAVVIGDGKSNWFKGVQLVVVYSLIALLAYFVGA